MSNQRLQNMVIVTEAWEPQVNGVVETLKNTIEQLEAAGISTTVISIYDEVFEGCTMSVPLAPENQTLQPLNPDSKKRLFAELNALKKQGNVDALHISTEGVLGNIAAQWAKENNLFFSTAVHTLFPEYAADRFTKKDPNFTVVNDVIKNFGYQGSFPPFFTGLKPFHDLSSSVMVTTPSMMKHLEEKGFDSEKMALWSRGVNPGVFHQNQPQPQNPVIEDKVAEYKKNNGGKPPKIYLYFGRVTPEKNIEDFLDLDLKEGIKVVVGPGPEGAENYEKDFFIQNLKDKYADAVFVPSQEPATLAGYVAMADVFVFPSKTDTFGRVVIESLACGTPVAAYNVQGPRDILTDPRVGALAEAGELDGAVKTAAQLSENPDTKQACIDHSRLFTPEKAAQQFMENLVQAETGKPFESFGTPEFPEVASYQVGQGLEISPAPPPMPLGRT